MIYYTPVKITDFSFRVAEKVRGRPFNSMIEDVGKRMKMDDLDKNRVACHGKIFCLITGASKGFGRAVAKSFAKLCDFEQGSVMVLSGRDEAGLYETKANVQEINNKISVCTDVWDLENVECIENFTSRVFNVGGSQFDRAILINNAGSLGDVTKKLVDPMPFDYYRKHFDINVSSVFLLIQQFFKAFKSTEKLVVNVSSLAAIKEMPYMSLYCTLKAARDMMHKVLACEEENVRVLNYAPGPMESEMSMEIQLNCGNEVSRTFFKELRESKKIIDPNESADKMIRIIKEDKFKSGDHIDFYDNV